MSPDDIDNFAIILYDMLEDRGFDLDENDDFSLLYDFCHEKLDKFCTKDRNYN